VVEGGATNPSVRVDTEQGPVVAIGIGTNPAQIANMCTGFGATSAGGGYSSCFASETGVGNTTPANQSATLMSDGLSNNNGMTLSKGRLNFPTSPFASLDPHHIITLIDSHPALTTATVGYRPLASVNDVFIGTDAPRTQF